MTSSPLFEPLRFANGVVAANRTWLAPLTNTQSHADGTLGDDELRFLTRRAEGGFGVVETCAAYVADDGKAWQGQLGVAHDAHAPGLARLAPAIAAPGALPIVQLFHGGLRANPALVPGGRTTSASAWEEPGVQTPQPATEADLARVIAAFRDAALRCERAGFAGVELHGAHGYLLAQFLSATQNLREDAWGGPFVKRARLLREVFRAVRGATSPGFVVGVRLSPEAGGASRGIDLDESLALATWLGDDGVDFLHVSLWKAEENTRKRPGEHPVPLFRAALRRDVPLVAAGNVWTREEAERLLARGADAVALGRAAIANPDWPRDARAPGHAPRRPPLTPDELAARAVSPTFVGYLRRGFAGFVAD